MSRRRSRKSIRASKPNFELSHETRHGIAVIFFFAIAAILLLSLLGMAGAAGGFITHALTLFSGGARYLVPLILIGIAILILLPRHPGARPTSIIGMLLFFAALTGVLYTFPTIMPDLTWSGGVLGKAISSPLVAGFGVTASIIIFVAVLLASVLLIGNTSIEALAKHGRFIGKIFGVLFRPIAVLKNLFDQNAKKHDEDFKDSDYDEADEETEVEYEEMELENETGSNQEKTSSTPTDEFSKGLKRRRKLPYAGIPLDLLNNKQSKPSAGDIKKNMEIIEKTLANFNINVQMGDIAIGPTVTQYTLKPDDGVKLTKITALHNDLALALAAHPIRIEAPIPGKSLVGIEVPNQSVATVGLREILETTTFEKRPSNLTIALGKDVAGKPWIAELPRLPHLLVAGATGSGKTVGLNAFIISLLYQNSPDDLKMILVDPKRVELPIYNGIPHLLVPVITDVPKTINALRWTISEMDRRFLVLEKFGARNIESYNKRAQEKMPTIVVIVDELADLMATAASEVEGAIIRIAQMARAVGIHLILATQRPSVDVITGLIKANIPARIAFSVASQIDSRTILDTSGAEKLLGRGDMLFTSPELSKPRRIQGAFVSDDEIKRVVDYLKSESEGPDYDETITEKQRSATVFSGGDNMDNDPLIPEAKEVIAQAGKASASLLQRRLKVGYARAARLLDLLEAEGFIGPGDGAKPREILMQTNLSEEDEEMPPWE